MTGRFGRRRADRSARCDGLQPDAGKPGGEQQTVGATEPAEPEVRRVDGDQQADAEESYDEACIGPFTGGRTWVDAWAARPAAGRYGVTVTTENMPALKWPGMLQTKR
jgi:hypothetical protein